MQMKNNESQEIVYVTLTPEVTKMLPGMLHF